MDFSYGSGYNALVEEFRNQEYPMLRGTVTILINPSRFH